MSIKRILVPVFGTQSDLATLETAAAVAKLFRCHIRVLYVAPDARERFSRFTHGEAAAIGEATLREMVAQLERAADTAARHFETVMRRFEIPTGDDPEAGGPMATWHVAADYDRRSIGRHGGLIDLIVIARPEGSAEPLPGTLDDALFTTGHPVLIAAPATRPHFCESVLVGWNPTLQSERAIARALPFLRLARRVVLLSVATGVKQGPGAVDAARYLAWHGIAATAKEVPPDHRNVGDILLAEAREMDADLLVMGAYSHSRLREMILGGVTRHILSHADLPVLMAH